MTRPENKTCVIELDENDQIISRQGWISDSQGKKEMLKYMKEKLNLDKQQIDYLIAEQMLELETKTIVVTRSISGNDTH